METVKRKRNDQVGHRTLSRWWNVFCGHWPAAGPRHARRQGLQLNNFLCGFSSAQQTPISLNRPIKRNWARPREEETQRSGCWQCRRDTARTLPGQRDRRKKCGGLKNDWASGALKMAAETARRRRLPNFRSYTASSNLHNGHIITSNCSSSCEDCLRLSCKVATFMFTSSWIVYEQSS